MSEVNIKKVLEFLQESRTRKDLEREFNLSQTQSYHMIKFLKKLDLITEIKIILSKEKRNLFGFNKKNRIWLYKAK